MIKFAKNFYQIGSKRLPFQSPAITYAFSRQAKTGFQSTSQSSTTQETKKKAFVPQGPSVEEMIQKDLSLNEYMSKIYKTTGLSIGSCLGLAYLISNTALLTNIRFLISGGLGLGIGGTLAFYWIPPIKSEKVWENPFSRKLAFSAIIAGSGMLLAPWTAFANNVINPTIVPAAAALSFLVMGGSSLYALKKPLGQFKTLESALMGGIFELLGINFISLMVSLAIGPNIFSLACSRVDTYFRLALFTAFQAYDTHSAIEEFKKGNYDLEHVIYFLNVFRRMIQILARLRK